MLTHLEALAALARHGTMTRAALDLRLTQSAVSKRIAALEEETGLRLLERDGRRVRLTSAAEELLRRTDPLLAQLRDAVASRETAATGRLRIGVSESILASWGAAALARVQGALPAIEIELHAHRSPLAVEHVRSGEYALALTAGPAGRLPGLVVQPLLEEELVVVRAARRRGPVRDVLSIEPGSATGHVVERGLAALRREGRIDLRITGTVESYAALVQLARSGFGAALAPIGIARALGVAEAALVRLPEPGVWRSVALVGRKTSFARPAAAAFAEALRGAVPRGSGYREVSRASRRR